MKDGISYLKNNIPFGVIVLAALAILAKPLTSSDLVLLPADLLKVVLPFSDELSPGVKNRLISDVMEQFYPYYVFAREELLNGHLPLWNPYVLNGTPFLATAVSAVLSPINLLLIPIPIESSYEWAALMKVILAALGIVLFLKRLGVSSWAAAVGGSAYAFSGYQIFFLLYPNTAVSMCLGWGLYSVEGLLQGVNRKRVAFFSIVVCISILGGQPECSLLSLLSWILYALIRSWRTIGRVFLASLLGVMMSAVVLIPFIELVLGGGTLDLRSWLEGNPFYMHFWQLPALIYPYFLGSSLNEAGAPNTFYGFIYFGLIPLTLSVIALFSRSWKSEMRSLWILSSTAFFILFGIFPFFDLFTSLPLLRNANHLHSALVLQASLCALSGFGVETLVRKEISDWHQKLVFGIIGLCGILGLVLFVQPTWNPDAILGSYRFGPWNCFVPIYPLCILGGLLVLYILRARNISVVALVLILVNGVFFGLDFNPSVSRIVLSQSDEIVHQLSPNDHDRIAALGVGTLLPNYGMSLGIRDVRGYESLLVKRVPKFYSFLTGQKSDRHYFFSTMDQQRVQLLQTVGTKRILSTPHYDLQGLKLLRSKFPYIYAVEGTGRVMISEEVKVVKDGHAALQHILTRKSHLETVVESAQGNTIGLQLAGFVGNRKEELKQKNKAEWILDLPDLVELRTVTSDPTFLVLRDTYYPGWRAFVDGHEVHIWRTDYLFRGVEVPAGEHTIRFEFSPLSFRVGLVISIISFLLVLTLATGPVKRLGHQ